MADAFIRDPEAEVAAAGNQPNGQDEASLLLDAEASRLAALSPLDYEQVRKAEAERLGVRVGTLDREVKRRRAPTVVADIVVPFGQGQPLELVEPEPWPEPVEGTALLDALATALGRHVSLPPLAAVALALWVVLTYLLDHASTNPRLAITSPQKRCGKTTLLGVLSKLVQRALAAASITPAAVFRSIEASRPSLLLDEADTFLGDNLELRGVLNSGHTRSTAFVIRTVGDGHEPRRFGTWCPMAIAAIGKLPGTLMDRSIVIAMRRRRPGEVIARLRVDRTPELDRLARMAARWAADHQAAFAEADPEVPAALNDRAADNWRPLLTIADTAGGSWPAQARAAALVLSGDQEDDSAAVLLLADIRDLFAARATNRLPSGEMSGALVALDDRPWSEWRNCKPLTSNALARLLKPFGIVPGTIRIGRAESNTAKGYYRDAFEEAWDRYLPKAAAASTVTPSQGSKSAASGPSQTVTTEADVTVANPPNAKQSAGCDDMTVAKGAERASTAASRPAPALWVVEL